MATHGGVYKEGEQKFIENIIPGDPTAFLPNVRVLPKIDALLNENKSRNNQYLKNLGFPVNGPGSQSQPQSQDAQAIAWAKANPNDPRSAKILRMNGGGQ